MHLSTRNTTHFPHLSHDVVIGALELEPGMAVAEVGPHGSGHLALPIARHLDDGVLIAVDVQKEILDILKERAHRNNLFNIDFAHGDITETYGIPVEDGSLDAVYLSNMLHQVDDKGAALEECARAIADDGYVLVIDWDTRKKCPYPVLHEYLYSHHELEDLADQTNLTHIDTFHISPYYWGMLLSK